jgi:formate C-acetyltransferase
MPKIQQADLSPTQLLRKPQLKIKSERISQLYQRLQRRMTQPQKNWGANHSLEGPSFADLPYVIRHAKAFEKTLTAMPIMIESHDLIVGNTVEAGIIVRTSLPRYATDHELATARAKGSLIEVGLAHKTPYYPLILQKGIAGILTDIEQKLTEITKRPPTPARDQTIALFEAMRIECQATLTLATRYSNLAEELAATAAPSRRDELLQIAAICQRVPRHPPTSFHEAIQAFWFIHYALFSTQTVLSCGRLDQFLQPFLEHDLTAGRITLEQAQELVDCLWLRFNDRVQIIRDNFFHSDLSDNCCRDSANRFTLGLVEDTPQKMKAGHRERVFFAEERADAINHFGQNILLSGIRSDGLDGTNLLTYLCLNAMNKFALTSPVVTVRLHSASPHELVNRVAQVLQNGGGQPFINNDDVLIPAYVDLGVPLTDARDYANSNCWETMIQGKSDQEIIRGINFLLNLELALTRGISRVTQTQLGIDTGDPTMFSSFSEVMSAWKSQTDYQLQQAITHIGEGVRNGTLEHSSHGAYCFNPFLSALTLDCIEKEKDVTKGGARYILWHVMGEALANAIDALAAIKKLVFEDKAITMHELITSLRSNWLHDERLRQRILSTIPKFSQDNEYADQIGREMMDYFIQQIRCYAQQYPTLLFPPGIGTFSWIQMTGGEVGATPDGRHSGDFSAANLSPAAGTDILGPTAAIRSYLKMRVNELPAGAPIDLRFSKTNVTGERGVKRLAGLMKTFIDLGGNMLTLTVTDVEELKKAMEDPEQYRHLRVRMGGWTAFFVMLNKEQQRLHIQRVEHGLL